MPNKIGLYDRNDPSFKVYKEFDNYLNKHEVYAVKGDYFLTYRKSNSKFKGGYLEGQFEMPVKALEWLLAVMARFKLPEQVGGYPNSQFTDFLYLSSDDDISVFRGLHHGLGEMAFIVKNKGRSGYISDMPPQEWDIIDRVVEEHNLLPVMTQIVKDYNDGKL